jgi:hypothetical protein
MALTTAAAATAALSHGSTTLAMATLQLSSAMWMPQMATARQGGMGTSSGLKAATSRAATMAPGPMEPTSKAVAGSMVATRSAKMATVASAGKGHTSKAGTRSAGKGHTSKAGTRSAGKGPTSKVGTRSAGKGPTMAVDTSRVVAAGTRGPLLFPLLFLRLTLRSSSRRWEQHCQRLPRQRSRRLLSPRPRISLSFSPFTTVFWCED